MTGSFTGTAGQQPTANLTMCTTPGTLHYSSSMSTDVVDESDHTLDSDAGRVGIR